MMEFPYPISETLHRVLMLEAIDIDYLRAGVGPPPFNTDHPPPANHPFTRMMSEPLAPPFEVEWSWMVAPPSGTLAPPALATNSAPAAALASAVSLAQATILALLVILTPVAHALEVSGGS